MCLNNLYLKYVIQKHENIEEFDSILIFSSTSMLHTFVNRLKPMHF